MGVTLRIQFPEARERTAVAALTAVGNPVATGHAVVTASPEVAAAHGNPLCDPLQPWGHPPAGRYAFAQRARQRHPYNTEYGWNILLFEPEAGDALAAKANGRDGLLVYGDLADKDPLMRRTQGGIRLDKTLMDLLTGRFQHEWSITLILEPLRAPSWWQFWKSLPETPLLSSTAVKTLAAPLDEASILDQMLGDMRQRRAYTGGGGTTDTRDSPREREQSRERDNRRDHDSYDNNASSHSSGSGHQGGGQHSGAGASGSWDSGRSAAAGVGVGIAAGAVAAAALSATAQDSGSSSSSYDSGSSSDSSSSDSSSSSSSD